MGIKGITTKQGCFDDSTLFSRENQESMPRVLTPEILDELPSDDPAAIRSRRDLQRINSVMGNYRWIARKMVNHADEVSHWIELGAGDGGLARHVSNIPVTGLDFAPRPAIWPKNWDWESGDLFQTLPNLADKSETIGVIANLFLHHFTDEQLEILGDLLGEKTAILIFSEPARHWIHQTQGILAHPFINHVTKHDMHVSIEAGFRGAELAETMLLSRNFEVVKTSHQFFGAYRVVAKRLRS